MIKLDYTVQFVTPAFLGNFEQQAQWRTPPFKTMLRQWWRVLKAGDFKYNHDRLREAEAELFGSAAGDQGRRSKLRIRLLPVIGHNSIWTNQPAQPIDNPSDGEIYLGYGPVKPGARSAIPETQKARLSLVLDKTVSRDMLQTLALCQRFATLGSRARNGWGSVEFSADSLEESVALPLCEWQAALDLDWPHGIGTSGGQPLIWETEGKKSWRDLMNEFFRIRKERVNKVVSMRDRPSISYPVKDNNHFGRNYRLPSQLLFKAQRRMNDNNATYIGTIVHLPHTLPNQRVNESDLIKTWTRIHEALNSDSRLQRVDR